MEPRRAFGDPLDKLGKPGMAAQGLNGAVIPCQLGLGQRGVNFIVTDLVQSHHRAAFAALQLGNEMVQALPCIRRDGPVAQGADGIVFAGQGNAAARLYPSRARA